MSHSVEISDDEDSFNLTQGPGGINDTRGSDTIQLSSDNESVGETSIKNMELTSDEDEELPKVSIKEKKQQLIKQLFPKATKFNNPSMDKTNVDASSSKSVKEPKNPGIIKMIGGVPVNMPVEPYGCQIALMSKVITAIKTKQNCLLESPTGSGKTLALLCSVLAWQRQERSRIGQALAQQEATRITELNSYEGAVDYVGSVPNINFNKTSFGEKSIYDKPVNGPSGDGTFGIKRLEPLTGDSPESGLVNIHKRRKLDSNDGACSAAGPPEPVTPEKKYTVPQAETPENVSVPTIYYGARTHKQLQQVIKEFARTSYCGEAKMSVLSSRDYSCIRTFDKQLWKTKNDMCRGCTKTTDKTKNCLYFENRTAIHHGNLPPAFDLEELVNLGKEKNACPYYAARGMAKDAHIVFCPYNYLIEPSIRNSMQIDLKDNIVVIDEAHNIEDICRDAASFTFSKDKFVTAIEELSKVTQFLYSGPGAMAQVEYVLKTLRTWDDWFVNQMPLVNNQPVNNNEAVYAWEAVNFVKTLNNHNIGHQQYKEFKHNAEILCQSLRDEPHRFYGVTQATGGLVESLDIALGYLFRDECQFMDDFKPVLVRTLAMDSMLHADSWNTSRFNQRVQQENLELRLLCMSSSVVWAGLGSARCSLLASGTLTPLHSLHSELGTAFPLRVSPNHVIAAERVWVGTLRSGPSGEVLECAHRGSRRPEVQDALAAALRHVCKVTPHGVLCFMPSYHLMNCLVKRWKETGVWREIEKLKNVFMESRNVRDHNDIMEDYYKYVSTDRGALLLAVFRGKVSEGMDFRDHQARAVLTIGIPYPNTYDLAVKEKMAYNDRYEKTRHLLGSSEWLRVQAFRALNQAVGRCVRHRGDWGAVLMLDSRFDNPYYTEHLSKWVRNFLNNNHHTYESLVSGPNNLESFMQKMTLMDQEDV